MGLILVAATSGCGPARQTFLECAQHEVVLASTAPRAIEVLASHSPDLLVSEIRLGPFNGLYLVIRHQESHPRMRAILIDQTYDRVLNRDAQRYGATYLSEPIDDATLLDHVSRSLGGAPKRRWPRKQLAGELIAEVQQRSARVLDLSYGGLRLEMPDTTEFPGRFPVVFPGRGLAIQARAVWTHPAAPGAMWCGAERFEADPTTETEWRHLVDSVQR